MFLLVVRNWMLTAVYAGPMSRDEEKDPPVPADVEGKIPKKAHDGQVTSKHDAQGGAAVKRTN